jgi:hypothetical protein
MVRRRGGGGGADGRADGSSWNIWQMKRQGMEDGNKAKAHVSLCSRLVDVYHWYRFPCCRVGCPFALLPGDPLTTFLMEGTMDLQLAYPNRPILTHSQLVSFLVDLDPPHPRCGQQNNSSPALARWPNFVLPSRHRLVCK